MEILSFGGGRRLRECQRLLEITSGGLTGRLILLPIPTTRDNIYLNGSDMPLSSVSSLLRPGDTLAGYGIVPHLAPEGVSVYDAALDERFLYENALISARGALGYILTNFPRDIADMSLGLVGYGRIGRALLRYLLALGADPTVYTRREEIALELGADGVKCSVLQSESDLSSLDILINTTPQRQIDESRLGKETVILDLASGSIFSDSPRLVKLASIPEAYYPLTAGRLYAEGILRHMDMEVNL